MGSKIELTLVVLVLIAFGVFFSIYMITNDVKFLFFTLICAITYFVWGNC